MLIDTTCSGGGITMKSNLGVAVLFAGTALWFLGWLYVIALGLIDLLAKP